MTNQDATIHTMPIKGSSAANRTPNEVVEKLMSDTMPDSCQGTEGYSLQNVLYSIDPMNTTTDIMSGQERNRRWGCIASIGIIPDMDQSAPGPAILPDTPKQLFAADSLEELRDRIVYELDKSIQLAKLAKDDPESYIAYMNAQHAQAVAAQQGTTSGPDNAGEEMAFD